MKELAFNILSFQKERVTEPLILVTHFYRDSLFHPAQSTMTTQSSKAISVSVNCTTTFPGEKLAYLFKTKAIWDNSSPKEQAEYRSEREKC